MMQCGVVYGSRYCDNDTLHYTTHMDTNTIAGTGMRTVDVGPPQLSMHSCREMMATDDVKHAVKLFVAAYQNYDQVAKAVSAVWYGVMWRWGFSAKTCSVV